MSEPPSRPRTAAELEPYLRWKYPGHTDEQYRRAAQRKADWEAENWQRYPAAFYDLREVPAPTTAPEV